LTSVTVLTVQRIPNTCVVQTACRMAWSNRCCTWQQEQQLRQLLWQLQPRQLLWRLLQLWLFSQLQLFCAPSLSLFASPSSQPATDTHGCCNLVQMLYNDLHMLCFDSNLYAPAADRDQVSKNNSGKCNTFLPIILLLTQGAGPSITWEGCMAIMLTT